MTLVLDAPLVGAQRPRISHVPEYVSSTGDEAIELAEMAGLVLDDWQQYVLTEALGERADGKWAARDVGLMVSRQSGKGALLEARELAALFLLEEPMTIHSAHQFDTSAQHFQRVRQRIEDTPELDRRVDKILKGHGNESITLKRNPKTGLRPELTFRTRTGAGGLGFSINCLIFDEAMIISQAMYGALLPTLSAQPNIQAWYTGSAVDEDNPAHDGVVFARVRERGMKGDDPELAYFEWSLDHENPDNVTSGEDEWAEANPGFGIRISPEHIAFEQRSMDSRTFAVQRLGVGAWPRTDGLEDVVIPPELWKKCEDQKSEITGHLCFAIDVTPDRSRTSICVAGYRDDGLVHVEVVDHEPGTGWVAERMAALVSQHKPLHVILDASGPGASLLPELKEHRIIPTVVTAKEYAQACGVFFDAVSQDRLRHRDERVLSEAVRGAVKRTLVDAWAWSRRNSGLDISPLVASTLAVWSIETAKKKRASVVSLSEALAKQTMGPT